MKTRFALLITMALLAVGLPIPAHADTPFTFVVIDDAVTITGYTDTPPADLVIPDEISNYPVTAIGSWAFSNDQLTALTLPDTLTTIGNYAFYDNELTALTLPDTLTTIGESAFADNRLTELTLPDSLTTISEFAFLSNRLTELTLPDTLTTISEFAFAVNQLTELTLPDTLTTISEFAFSSNQLTALTLPDTLTTIGGGAFSGNLLTELTLPDTLTTISNEAFYGNGLTALTLPDSLTTIGVYAFAENPLARVRFTGAAPELGTDAFGEDNPTVRFPWKFGAPRAAGGYTAPAWNGYSTIPVADVTFTGGGDIDAQSVDVNGTAMATKPADPTRTGHVFTGWYADEETTPFDFATPITGDTALIAGFKAGIAPTITGPATASAKLGATVAWEPATLTGDPAVTITATGLPSGLTIDPATGVISGKVTDAALTGDHPVTITATNGIDPAATHEVTISIEYFTSTVADEAVTISGYHGTVPTDLVIPDEISDHPVTAIGDGAFTGNRLTALTLPDALTTIGSHAFAFNQLTELTLPDTLTTISNEAFYANELTELTLPDTLTTIGDGAFGDNRLASVRLAGPAPQLGTDAFGTRSPTVRFPWKFGAPRAAGGYTTPTWNGYSTIPVADVTFTGGGDIDTQPVDVNGTAVATKPVDPTKTGHIFTGWYVDEATTPFDFATPITGDTALTAGFKLPTVPIGPADPAISGLDPAITGNAREGQTLRAKPGLVSPTGATITYQWHADGKTIKGATKRWLPLRKAQAGKRITVTITAKAATAAAVTKTSAKTKVVSSAKRRLVLSTYTVGKNKPLTVTATGFKARQKIIIWLGGTSRYVGRANSRGIITKTVTFAKNTDPGKRRVRVSGYNSDGDRNRTVHTKVKYR